MSIESVSNAEPSYVQQYNVAGGPSQSVNADREPQKSKYFVMNDSVSISDEARTLLASQGGTSVLNDYRFATRESRDSEAARYGDILKDLRSKYGEEEAIERFDALMRSEGFERQGNISDPAKQNYGSSEKFVGGFP